jgi:heme A synthase
VFVVTVLGVMAVWAHVQPREIALPLVGIVVVAALMVMLRLLTRAVAETPRRDLDERDRDLRDAAWRQAYVLTLVALAVFVTYAMVVGGAPEAGNQAMRMGVVFLLCCVSAPTLALAWTLPNDDPEDHDQV